MGWQRARTFGPETGLAALLGELFGELVSDGRAAGLRAPRTDLSCRESSETRRQAAWPVALVSSTLLSVSKRTDTCQVPGPPVWPLGPRTVAPGRSPPPGGQRGATAGERGSRERRGGAVSLFLSYCLSYAHPWGDEGQGFFRATFGVSQGVELRSGGLRKPKRL